MVAAFTAMANLGIHESKVKPVLKKLLKLYDKNWALIEEESYRALADAIFEEEENKVYFGTVCLSIIHILVYLIYYLQGSDQFPGTV